MMFESTFEMKKFVSLKRRMRAPMKMLYLLAQLMG